MISFRFFFNFRKFFLFKMMTNGVGNDDVANFVLSLSVHIFICVMQKRCTIQHHKYEFMFVFSVRTKNNEKHYSLQFHFISLLIRLNKMIMIRIEMQQYIFHLNGILILGILLCYYLCHLQIIIV